MQRRYALQSLSLLALPSLLAACGPGDSQPSPTPVPPGPTPDGRWNTGEFLGASTFGPGTRSLSLRPDGHGKMLALLGTNSDTQAFSVNSQGAGALKLEGSPIAGNLQLAMPDGFGGIVYVWSMNNGAEFQPLLFAVADGTNGQIGTARSLPVSAAQTQLLAQDGTGNAIVRWSGGPLDSTGQYTQWGLLQYASATQTWTAIALPDPLVSPVLLTYAKAEFDSLGRAWLVQPVPTTVPGGWTLRTFLLTAGAQNWSPVNELSVSTPRSPEFQLSIDASNRLLLAHSAPHNPAIETVPVTVSRLDTQGAGWSDLPASNLPSFGYQIRTDALGNVWALGPYAQTYGTQSIARYDDAARAWTGPATIGFAPSDAYQDANGNRSMAFASDHKGNAWALGVRQKTAGQDLPVLWVSFFDVASGQWSQPTSVNVLGGENSEFVQPANGTSGTTFQVALSFDALNLPVAAVTEMLSSSWTSYKSRTWTVRGQAS